MDEHQDPICGMKGTIPAHGFFFCSDQCIKKYEKQHDLPPNSESCPSCKNAQKKPWYKERLYIISLFTFLILSISSITPSLYPFFTAFIEYLSLIWWAILLGFLIGGIIDYMIPGQYIEKYLSRHRKRTILYAIIFGFLMSACSHGILAISIALYKKGANTSSVIAFLLAAPWANLPITILLFGFFGVKALFIVLTALFIAFTTGLMYLQLEKKGLIECKHCTNGKDVAVHTDFSIRKDVSKRWNAFDFTKQNIYDTILGTIKGSWGLTKMIMWWLLIGMLMAAFARAFIPDHLFMMYMGPSIAGLLITLLFATIIEVCSEGSSPLAFEIFNKTGAFGNSFTFLMAGVASDYTEIGLIWTNIGKRAALWLPLLTIPQILFFGYLFNLIL
ncbi:MAG: permease [Candidatus Thermoplasmatota archaeon]|nr:permease [Candidatus Thermoplasmatota archaeon]